MPLPPNSPLIGTINGDKVAVIAGDFHGNIYQGNSPKVLTLHQPDNEWKADSVWRFHYSARATALFGRDVEQAKLREFSDSPSNFLWWGITGKGGAGKSRLALEFALELGKEVIPWEWTFLRQGDDLIANLNYLADDWTPKQPTLLIVDYVFTVSENLKAALNACTKNAKQWHYPVRLLFLERTTEGGWHERLMSALSNEEKIRILEARHANTYLALDQFSRDEAQKLIEEVLRRYELNLNNKNLQHSITSLLDRLDIEHRPLYALFLADAIAKGKGDIVWNTEALIEQILARELERWKIHGVTEKDKQLLRFTTLAGQLDMNATEPQSSYINNLLNDIGYDKNYQQFKHRWAGILHADDIDTKLPKLEPDLLGELFVLSEWFPPVNQRQWENGEWKAELQACWGINHGLGLADFLFRAAQDFPDHRHLLALIRAVGSTQPDQLECHQQMSWLYFALITVWNGANPFEMKAQWFDVLQALVKRWPQSEQIAIQHANAALNLGVAYGNAGKEDLAEAMYKAIAPLAKRWPQSEVMAICHAKAAYNLGLAYSNAGNEDLAETMYLSVGALAESWPQSEEIAVQQVYAVFSLSLAYGNSGKEALAEAMCDAIGKLAERWPQSEEITIWHAKAMYNLGLAYGNAGNEDSAEAMYAAVKTLAERWPQSEETVIQQASAALNLGVTYGNAGKEDLAETMYDVIRTLVERWPQSEQIAIQQASAALNLGIAYGNAGKEDLAETMYKAIGTLADRWPQSEVMTVCQAKAAYNLGLAYSSAGKEDLAETMYISIGTLTKSWPESEEIAVQQVYAVFSLGLAYGNAGKETLAEAMYAAIDKLAKRWTQSEEITVWQAKAAYNLGLAYGNAGKETLAEAMYITIGTLVEHWPQSEQIAIQQANAALNLGVAYENAGKKDLAETMYEAIVSLAERWPLSEEMTVCQAKAIYNLGLVYGNADKEILAEAMYVSIGKLAEGWQQSEKMAIQQVYAIYNLGLMYLNADKKDLVKSMVAAVDAMAERWPQSKEIVDIQGMVEANLILSKSFE